EVDVWERRAPVDMEAHEAPGDAHEHAKPGGPAASEPVKAELPTVGAPAGPAEPPEGDDK
ncbi:MAG TPA: hypothetical protein VIU61_29685, partial [Kofleriaceae bacterium]